MIVEDKEMHIVIVTATYNHCKLLLKLYDSLKQQSLKDFKWIIVDDGSKDDTEKVVSNFCEEEKVDIKYIKKENGGKSSSLNLAFKQIKYNALAVIVDDDEQLDYDAIEKIEKYYQKYYLSKVGMIHFHRKNVETNEIIANYMITDDLNLDYREFKSKGYNADGYIAYFGYTLENMQFPIYPGEKYIAPSVMLMLCGEKYEMIWAKEAIGTTEYMEGGITKQGRKLRVKNPIGMLLYCTLYQRNIAGLRKKFEYSLMGFAYQYISGKSKNELLELGIPIDSLNNLMKIYGIILGKYWERKYLM